jgi:8-oxo-dGTP diphosphatase
MNIIEVAVGVLIRGEAELLLTSRPSGKVYAGYWEFPGGKLETGESVEQALRRELHEELGITIGTAHEICTTEHAYPHGHVRLHFCKVFDWTGALAGREGQAFCWQTFPLQVSPILPGAYPLLDWLAREADEARLHRVTPLPPKASGR